MEDDQQGESEKVVELYPAPAEPQALTPTQLEVIRLLNEASALLAKMGALILDHWTK